MTKLNKLFAVLLCAAMALALVRGVVMAEEPADGLVYTVYDDHVEITSYTGNAVVLNIPAEIEGKPVTSIGEWTFEDCAGLTGVTIPAGVTSIGENAFYCGGIAEINVDDNNENYKSREGVLFNKEMTVLIQHPRGNARTSYSIPDGVTGIASGAFAGCKSLTGVTIPASVTSIGSGVFDSCYRLAGINVSANNKNYRSREGVLFNKEMTVLIQCPIGNARKSYSIPDGVTSIGECSFLDCTGLADVTIPASVTSIGKRAFDGCDSLIGINIGSGVTNIGDQAFSYCISLTGVTIPDNVTSIGEWVFEGCTSLTSVVIPDNVASISTGTFDYCESLVSITIPASVTSIGNQAFAYCSSLADVYYDGSESQWANIDIEDCNDELLSANIHFSDVASEPPVTVIPDGLEYEVYDNYIEITGYSGSSAKLDIPTEIEGKPVTNIGSVAFSGCKGLINVTIGSSVTSIGEYAFDWCDSLAEINVDAKNEKYRSQDGALFDKEMTVLIKYPIGNARTGYAIPNNVTNIGERAFWGCATLMGIVIPVSVTSIGNQAFTYCSGLTDVYYAGSESDWDKISIDKRWGANDPLLNANIHYAIVNHEPEIMGVITSIDTTTGGIEVAAETTGIPDGATLIAIGISADDTMLDLAPMTDGKAKLSGEIKAVKVFCWESLESMCPLCEAKEVEVTQ